MKSGYFSSFLLFCVCVVRTKADCDCSLPSGQIAEPTPAAIRTLPHARVQASFCGLHCIQQRQRRVNWIVENDHPDYFYIMATSGKGLASTFILEQSSSGAGRLKFRLEEEGQLYLEQNAPVPHTNRVCYLKLFVHLKAVCDPSADINDCLASSGLVRVGAPISATLHVTFGDLALRFHATTVLREGPSHLMFDLLAMKNELAEVNWNLTFGLSLRSQHRHIGVRRVVVFNEPNAAELHFKRPFLSIIKSHEGVCASPVS